MKSDLEGLAEREAAKVTINARANDPRFVAVLERLRLGQSIRGACGLAKMPRKILYQWMDQDQDIRDLVDEAIDQGLGNIETRFMMGSDNDSPTDWRAMSWMLARRFPDAYGEKKELSVSTNDGAKKQLEMVSAMIEQTSEIMSEGDDE
jgi:hypothetical protein